MKKSACVFALLSLSTTALGAEFVGEPTCKVARLFVANEPVAWDWDGPCKDGYATGAGVLVRKRKGALVDTTVARYEVTMEQGEITGQGTIKYENGARYVGFIRHGVRHGKGYTTQANGNQYEGEYKYDRPDGSGTLLKRDQEEYVGGWKNGKFDGFGTIKFALGGSYEGGWKAGKFDGKGVLTYVGSGHHRLEGEFEDGRVRGKPTPAQAQPPQWQQPMRDLPTGSLIAKRTWTGGRPIDKPYAELTPEQQATVRKPYEALEEGDEPPYPLHGLKPVFELFEQAQGRAHANGELHLHVLVGKDGNVLSVTTIDSPSPQLADFAASVLAKEKYKPALCRGTPCDMKYPFRLRFAAQH